MTTPDIKAVRRIFEQAVKLPKSEREAFIVSQSSGNKALLEKVVFLLQADEDKYSLLKGQAIDVISPDDIDFYVGKKAGAYRIVRELGRGGMGTVFLGSRADGQFEQQVAIKLIKPGMDTREIVARFESERQILARLEHPNIARLLDGGKTEYGVPYFAMELVDGLPITEFCDQHKLSIAKRLQLFQTVCASVAYAHKNLLIHRDLKPGNILVTQDSTVKLLDFGIAKALTGDAEQGPQPATLTVAGHRRMTPEYASPEQVRGQAVNTATDIYSLGIILYELLVGRRPYHFGDSSPREIERIICDTEPEKPSTALHKLAGSESVQEESALDVEAISALRSARPERLRKRLSGDLDNVCLKALRKEPERRYASVEQLGDDVRRHLQGLPVQARPDTFAYRTQKFVYRNKLSLLVAVTVFMVISGLVGYYTAQLTEEQAKLGEERDRAKLEAQKAEQVSDFLKGLFEVSNPRESKGETITARALLDHGAARISEELTEQPAVRAEMMHVIGEVYCSLGLFEKADSLLNQALVLRRKLFGEAHPDVAKTLSALGVCYEILGRFADAETMHRAAIAILRVHANDQPLALAASLHSLAHVQIRLYHLDDAEHLLQEALAIKRKHLGGIHTDVAYSLNILGDVLSKQGKNDEAEAIHRQVLALRRELLGPDHLEVSSTLHNLGATLLRQERYAEAEAMYREALRLQKKHFGDHDSDIGNTLSQLGFVVGRQGRYEEAEAIHREALAILHRVFGNEHYRIAYSYSRFATLKADQGRYAEAEMLCRKFLDMGRRLLGEQHTQVVRGLARLGTYVWKQGRFKEAEGLLLEANQLSNSMSDSTPELHEFVRVSLAEFYEAWGRQQEAEKYTK